MSAKSEDAHPSAQHIVTAMLAEADEPTKEQWKALIDQNPDYALEIAAAALEHGVTHHLTPDDLTGPIPAEYTRSLSWAITTYHAAPRPEVLAVAQRIQQYRGPAVKPLAHHLGLGKYSILVRGVLAGSIRSPRRITARLADMFQTRVDALTDAFAREFAQHGEPAFKAKGTKPHIRQEPQAWDEAIRSLELSEAETDELLALDT